MTEIEHGPASTEHTNFCFAVLQAHLNNTRAPAPTFADEKYPLFVTWKIARNDQLRGCIGTFAPLPLHTGLSEFALTSALQDSRFEPITLGELPELKCYVSLLTNFEKADGWHDWKIGKHGIRIHFDDHGKNRSATYLPEVAEEQGWDHVQTIDSLLRKGGFRGNITQTVRESISLVRYQSSKAHSDYSDYLTWRSNSN